MVNFSFKSPSFTFSVADNDKIDFFDNIVTVIKNEILLATDEELPQCFKIELLNETTHVGDAIKELLLIRNKKINPYE